MELFECRSGLNVELRKEVVATRMQEGGGILLFNQDWQLPATLELLRLGAVRVKARPGP